MSKIMNGNTNTNGDRPSYEMVLGIRHGSGFVVGGIRVELVEPVAGFIRQPIGQPEKAETIFLGLNPVGDQIAEANGYSWVMRPESYSATSSTLALVSDSWLSLRADCGPATGLPPGVRLEFGPGCETLGWAGYEWHWVGCGVAISAAGKPFVLLPGDDPFLILSPGGKISIKIDAVKGKSGASVRISLPENMKISRDL